MTNSDLKKIVNYLSLKPGKIVITSHKNPDGDAIGSSLALYEYLKLKNFEVNVIIPNSAPAFLNWLPNSDQIIIYQDDAKHAQKVLKESETLFSLDYNAMHRTGDMKEVLESFKGTKILIDHHLEPSSIFDLVYSTTKTSSTSELIYDLIEESLDVKLINKNIAEAIYVGIVTDTGSFSYACNYPKTYRTVASLIECGIDGERIHRLVYDTFSEDRLNLLGFCLSQRLVVLPDCGAAYIYLYNNDLKRFNFQVGDTEGIVNYALSIDKVKVAVLLTERDKLIRISFRSKSNFSVNDFARNYFDGGGHQKAAGGNSTDSMDTTIKKLNKLLQQHKNEILTSI